MAFYVYRPRRIKNGKPVKARLYRGRFTVGHDPRVHDVALRVVEKQVAIQLLTNMRRDLEREYAGLIPSRAIREAAMQPLIELVEECIASKTALGRSDRYIRQLRCQLARLREECGWQTVGDITAKSFERWRSMSRVSGKTCNEYLNAASSFCSWLVKTQRLAENPMRFIEAIKTAGRATYERRALTIEELKQLIAVAGKRAPVYVVAAFTGLRRKELTLLEWRDVHLGASVSFIRLRAETTKSKKTADIPLHRDVVAALLRLHPGIAKAKVFPSAVPRMSRFNNDLAAAGIALCDESGRKVHFHSLRHTFCTLLQANGASVREAQTLMRHTDARLTAKVYTDNSQLPLFPAVDRLPSILGASLIDSLDSRPGPALLQAVAA